MSTLKQGISKEPSAKRKMDPSVILSDHLVKQAQAVGEVLSRSSPGQMEHWAKTGKIAEENPD
ncbi:MAG: hypothetical protein NTU48_00225 [Legionellales bacterium]|nr:hypothetical protein [Legionellales bacterium]